MQINGYPVIARAEIPKKRQGMEVIMCSKGDEWVVAYWHPEMKDREWLQGHYSHDFEKSQDTFNELWRRNS